LSRSMSDGSALINSILCYEALVRKAVPDLR
jgi:hypothetical protein